ncbi:Uncharacterised protein [[Flavobacterium] thermophilum]|nr:Uncharacterised protein [[Flavobacterium] thermophilum]
MSPFLYGCKFMLVNLLIYSYCNYLNKVSNNSLYYLGDWHTHLSSNLLPSPTDYKAAQTLASYLPEDIRFSLITVIFNHFFTKKF